MQKTTSAYQMTVPCSMESPIEHLIDRLSSKSPQLYIFWQNYDQLYRHYNDKLTENSRLRDQLDATKKMLYASQHQAMQVRRETDVKIVQEDPYLKDRLKTAEATCEQLRTELEKSKTTILSQKSEQTRLVEEISQMQLLISQLREQNSQQQKILQTILQKLKTTQSQLSVHQKLYQQVQQKDRLLAHLTQRQKDLQSAIQERDDQIQKMNREFKDAKAKYERIIRDSLQNAKETVMSSIGAKGVDRKGEF